MSSPTFLFRNLELKSEISLKSKSILMKTFALKDKYVIDVFQFVYNSNSKDMLYYVSSYLSYLKSCFPKIIILCIDAN